MLRIWRTSVLAPTRRLWQVDASQEKSQEFAVVLTARRSTDETTARTVEQEAQVPRVFSVTFSTCRSDV